MALEGCNRQHHPAHSTGANLGNAYVLQYDATEHLQARILLPYPGLRPALITTEPHADRSLISQDQPENAGYPAYDRIYALDGTHLRQIAHYDWGSEFLAVPS